MFNSPLPSEFEAFDQVDDGKMIAMPKARELFKKVDRNGDGKIKWIQEREPLI